MPNGGHSGFRLPFPEKILCLIRNFFCPCFSRGVTLGFVGRSGPVLLPETCRFGPLSEPEPGGDRTPGSVRGSTSAGRGNMAVWEGVGFPSAEMRWWCSLGPVVQPISFQGPDKMPEKNPVSCAQIFPGKISVIPGI